MKQARCKPCQVAYVRDWEKLNPEKRRASRARYRALHREELKKKNLAYYHEQMVVDPERIRKNRRDWAKTPKGIISNRSARHNRRGAPLSEEAKELLRWWMLCPPLCFYCEEVSVEVDHIIPISKGGTGEVHNLRPSCRSCNASKNDKL